MQVCELYIIPVICNTFGLRFSGSGLRSRRTIEMPLLYSMSVCEALQTGVPTAVNNDLTFGSLTGRGCATAIIPQLDHCTKNVTPGLEGRSNAAVKRRDPCAHCSAQMASPAQEHRSPAGHRRAPGWASLSLWPVVTGGGHTATELQHTTPLARRPRTE